MTLVLVKKDLVSEVGKNGHPKCSTKKSSRHVDAQQFGLALIVDRRSTASGCAAAVAHRPRTPIHPGTAIGISKRKETQSPMGNEPDFCSVRP